MRIKACPRTRSDVVANGTGCAQEEALSNNFLEQRHACLHTVRERLAQVLVAEPKECIKLRKRCPACHLLVSSRADLVVETAHGRASRQFNSGYELFSDQRATGIIQWHQRSVGFLEVES